MTSLPMTFIATMLVGAAVAAEPSLGGSEVPELASMALLSVVLAGASLIVRRTGPKPDDRDGGGRPPRS